MAQIEDSIRTYIADNILFSSNGYPHPDDASFLENGVVDSMNILELVAYIEEKFKVTVSDDEIMPENFDSITRLANFIRGKSK